MSTTATILYTFEFTGDYNESIFAAAPTQYVRDSLRTKVIAAVDTEKRFLVRFPRVNRVAQQVEDLGEYFKVILNRA
jgi:hypothetical protein